MLGIDLVAFVAVEYPSGDTERLGAEFDGGLRVGDEVVEPIGVGVGAGLAGEDEDPAVGEVRHQGGVIRSVPDLAPRWWTSTSGFPSNMPPALPPVARNSSMTFWFIS